MATTSRVDLRKLLSEAFQDYLSLTTSKSGTSQGDSLVDTSLRGLPGGKDADYFTGWYVLLTSGSATGEIGLVSSHDPDSGTLNFGEAFSAQVATSVTYELHRIDPVWKHDAISAALRQSYRDLYLPLRDETLVIDDTLANGAFQTFAAGTFTNWTEVGSPTTTAETTIVHFGSQSAKVVAAAGGTDELTQAPQVNVEDAITKGATHKRWVYATAATTARIGLDWDGTTIAFSAYHTGDDNWELLHISSSIPASATQVKAVCQVAASGTAYFNDGYVSIGPIYKYTIPTSFVQVTQVLMQFDESDIDGIYVPLVGNGTPLQGRRLLLVGKGLLTQPSTDLATTEIGAPQTDLLMHYAAQILAERLANSPNNAQSTTERYERMASFHAGKKAEMAIAGFRMARLPVTLPRGAWHIDEDASGRYIEFDVSRAPSVFVGIA